MAAVMRSIIPENSHCLYGFDDQEIMDSFLDRQGKFPACFPVCFEKNCACAEFLRAVHACGSACIRWRKQVSAERCRPLFFVV